MGESVGCQPSWDASDSPGYPTFLLALSKKGLDINNVGCLGEIKIELKTMGD